MPGLRCGIVGCGFWARYQLAGWRETGRVEVVAACDREPSRARALAAEFGIAAMYDDAADMIARERLSFLDVITDAASHEPLVALAAGAGLPVVCQKPLAPEMEAAERMVRACRSAGVPLFVNENWRWQRPLREVRRALVEDDLGPVHRARIDYVNSFPVYDNQPALRELERFVLMDMGTHVLDTARFLFGEAETVYCRTVRVDPSIRGEDVATVILGAAGGATVTCGLSYASPIEHDRFPETFVLAECRQGSVELGPDCTVRVTRRGEGTRVRRFPPPHYPWIDSRYALVQSAIVACQASLAGALLGEGRAETTGEDNLRTLRLVEAAYESASSGDVVRLALDSAHRRW